METHQSPEYHAFIRGICEQPEDDLRRLVFADWLDEHGENERGTFTRVQVELAKPRTVWFDPESNRLEMEEVDALRRRETELLEQFNRTWFHPFREQVIDYKVTRGFVSHVTASYETLFGGECSCDGGRWDYYDPSSGEMKRGVKCSLCSGTGRTQGIAADLFRNQPVEGVTLTGKEPWTNVLQHGHFGWWEDSPQHRADGTENLLSRELMNCMDEDPRRADHGIGVRYRKNHPTPGGCILFPTREAALQAASAAAVRLGRQRAGCEKRSRPAG